MGTNFDQYVRKLRMSEEKLMQAMFNQQRLQIMSLGVHHDEYSDAYLYAWSEGIYPFFEDTDGSVFQMPHEVYEEFFQLSRAKVDIISKYLDDMWLEKKIPTFYELENKFNTRARDEWSRIDLIHICRYLFLHDSFDGHFWRTLLTPMEHPSEAASIIRKFNRVDDVYFM